MLKSTRQLVCVFQDMEPLKSSSISRKNSDIRKPVQRVKFTKAVLCHTKIRDQSPSLGLICPSEPHQRRPNAPKFEDRSQEETEWQEQSAREAAWKLDDSVLKLKERNKITFFLPSENRCLSASTLENEERDFVVDSGASMHMISKKKLKWCWNGYLDKIVWSYDTHNRQRWIADAWRGNGVRQRIGYILDNESPRGYVSSLIAWKASWWTRIFLGVDQRSKTTSNFKRDSDTMQHGELRSDRGSSLSTNSSSSSHSSTSISSSRQEGHHSTSTNDEFDCAKHRKASICCVIYCIRKSGENKTRKSKSSECASWDVW